MLKYFIRTIPLKHFEFEAKEDFNKYNTDKKFKKEYSKFTPAMLSIVSYNTSEDKKLECLKLLLEKGVNTNCKDEYDNNLLHLAVQNKCNNILRFLVENVKDLYVGDANKDNETPIQICIQTNNEEGVDILAKALVGKPIHQIPCE